MNGGRRRICILGSTGTIGEKTLQVIGDWPDRFEVVGLSAHSNAPALARQVENFRPEAACLSGPGALPSANGRTRMLAGTRGLIDLIDACRPDLVVVALVGAAGLAPTLQAIEAGATIALANKEVLVTAGELTMARARARGVPILPVDSEHNAIFQCLQGQTSPPIRRIILTASGGPFRGRTREQLQAVTVEQALRHPTWAMGRKITIDSATMMNKGLELIEARHLFGVAVDQVEIVVHPQSIVHSMVEFADGSILAQMGVTDMYLPIVHVLSWPERLANRRFEPIDLTRLGSLRFESYDPQAFPCPALAREASRRGGTMPAVLNAANEVAVDRFLSGQLGFTRIPAMIEAALQSHDPVGNPDWDAIASADRWAREFCLRSPLLAG
jgi:1-deoxy-D-xylulose-5-phosphate reductoisomerase